MVAVSRAMYWDSLSGLVDFLHPFCNQNKASGFDTIKAHVQARIFVLFISIVCRIVLGVEVEAEGIVVSLCM